MKKWILVLPLVCLMGSAQAAMSLEEQMLAVEQAVMAEAVGQQGNLPKKFADEKKQAEFDKNLKKVISGLEKESNDIISQYMSLIETQISKQDKKALEEAKSEIVTAQEFSILTSLMGAVGAKVMGEELRFPTEEEQNTTLYAVYHLLKSSTEDYSRYLRHLEPPQEQGLSAVKVMTAMDAFYEIVKEVATAK